MRSIIRSFFSVGKNQNRANWDRLSALKNRAAENSLESTAAPSSAEVITSSLTAEDAAETVLPRAARSAKVSKAAKPAAKVRTVAPVAAIFNTHKQSNNLDIDHNVFMDALEYTGYNLKKHRADGNMWKYIYAADKRGMGYLSSISYGGASSGYEVTGGKPDVAAMAKKGGLVCASYVTYVYFNYLPNVAGISTNMLDKPAKPINANDWKIAAGKWVQKGYSRYIPFTAKILPSKCAAAFRQLGFCTANSGGFAVFGAPGTKGQAKAK